jgi:predicted amidohydrolase
MKLYYAAAIQTNFKSSEDTQQIVKNTQRMCDLIEQTVVGYQPFFDVKLFVLPEFSHQVPVHLTVDKLYQLAVKLPNKFTDQYIKLAQKYDIYIQTGSFLEKDSNYPGHVFNTSLLIDKSGIIGKYRKVNTWIPWEVHTSPADIADYRDEVFPVIDTAIGKIGVAICYDWLFPEVLRELRFKGAEIINRVSAYMDPWGVASPMDWWTVINRSRAIENMVYVVAANQAASCENYPPFSWPGGSMVVDYDGRILAQADPGPHEKVVVAPINIDSLRHERQRRIGHDTVSHSRSHAYSYLQSNKGLAIDESIPSTQALEQRIKNAKLKDL